MKTTFSDLQAEQDETGIRRSQVYFHSLIKSEIEDSKIPSNRIVLGGFSQGGAMSIFSGITCPTQLGGIFGMSCYLLLRNKLQEFLGADGGSNKQTKIWMGHGDSDPLVKPEWGIKTAEVLRGEGYDVQLKMYPYVHLRFILLRFYANCIIEVSSIQPMFRRLMILSSISSVESHQSQIKRVYD